VEYYSSREVAKLLKLQPSTIRQLVKREQLGCSKIGNRLRFSNEDIDIFMKRTRKEASNE